MAQENINLKKVLHEAKKIRVFTGVPFSPSYKDFEISRVSQNGNSLNNNDIPEIPFLIYNEFFKDKVDDNTFTGLLPEPGADGIQCAAVLYNGAYPSVSLIKVLIPPKCFKVEFFTEDGISLGVLEFYDINTYGDYIYNKSYYWWSVLRLESKLETENNDVEYILHTHKLSSNAHKDSTMTIGAELQHDSLSVTDDYDFFFPKTDESNGSYSSQIVNGTLITKTNQLCYLGNLQKDGVVLDNTIEKRALVPTIDDGSFNIKLNAEGIIFTYHNSNGRLIEPLLVNGKIDYHVDTGTAVMSVINPDIVMDENQKTTTGGASIDISSVAGEAIQYLTISGKLKREQ